MQALSSVQKANSGFPLSAGIEGGSPSFFQ